MDSKKTQAWRPTTVAEVKKIIEENLKECDAEQAAAFDRYGIEPYVASIIRYGKTESVVVVARRGNEVIYWEDVENGFNISPTGPDGKILEHWCNQDELRFALNAWIEGRRHTGNSGPGTPIHKRL